MTPTSRRTAIVLAVLVPLLGLPLPALAVDDPVTGYWSRTQTGAPLPLEPPTPVPEGGSWVAADPAGPLAVSALRVDADPGQVVTGLQLPVSDVVGTPSVIVCPTTETWVPQQNGRLQAAPAADCTSPVEARVEQELLLVDLPPALQGASVDLLLAPGEGQAFSVTLERATAQAVVQGPDPAAAAPLPAPAPAPALPPSEPGFGSAFDPVLPGLVPPAPAAEPLLPPPALPAPAAAPQPQAAPPVTAPLAVAPQAVAEPDRTASLMAVALLAGLAVLALRLAQQPATPPRHLGGGARLSRSGAATASPAPVVAGPARGVGRFRAPRVHPPVRI